MAERTLIDLAIAPSGELLVRGEIDLQTGPALQQALDEVIRSGTGDVVVDLSGVEFMDSAGLNVLVRAVKQLIEQDRCLVLHAPTPAVRRILTLGGADTFVRYA
ncbi:MAG TPA: STAS domain-containing protein [Acidimicrobiales bacterium]|nr:STAS domain-containing protein [Acidimicrobiales bacterium]